MPNPTYPELQSKHTLVAAVDVCTRRFSGIVTGVTLQAASSSQAEPAQLTL
jgi:hypothetical protein